MRWKQFFTPVESMDAIQARKFIDENKQGSYTLLDVRQPGEYEAGHIPGSRLIPLPDIKERFSEIDPNKPAIVYCAIGGRSRVAAQMLAGENFSKVYNLSGGFKAWQGNYAVGPEDQGLDLFTAKETPEQVLIIAYSLEKGLRDFYRMMIPKVTNERAQKLFHQLFAIELLHQNRLIEEYRKITGTSIEAEKFDRDIVSPAMEGGINTDEYIQKYGVMIDSDEDVIGLAMSIEAQALDLYSRAGENNPNPESSEVLKQIALEEQAHLKQLGELL
jgi:rhodanese-related sulfurtransferase